jgi:hypothetical protein
MEMKPSLTISTYKQLSKSNEGWKKTYIAEKPWKEMAVDVDSLVFFYMRKYIDIPYPSRKDERMVAAAFLHNIRQSTQWILDDMARYSIKQLTSLLNYLKSIGLVLHPVCSTGYPKLKCELRDERLRVRSEMERKFREMDPLELDAVLPLMNKYILHFRDEVRDVVVEHKALKHIRRCTEADKWCGKNHRVTISEDVDIFLFGSKKTIIVKPFLDEPQYFHFVDCKSYFTSKGIANYDDFIQVAFMMGTDYNRGIKGMGEKRSVEAINKHDTVAKYVAVKYDITDENVERLMKRYKKFIEYIGSF